MSEFLKKLSKSLGISYVWWQWRWINFKKRWKAFFSADKNVVRHLKSSQKICRRCGALAAAEDRKCNSCGSRLPSAAGNFFYKVFGLVMPGVSPITALITVLIAANFLIQVFSTGGSALLAPSAESLLRMGALHSGFVAAGQWWRLVTCVFVHIGIIHFLFNMFALLSVSHFIEDEIGPTRYFSLFLLTGLGGSIVSFIVHKGAIAAGASGAIFGLIGFSISYFRRQGGARAKDIQSFMIRWAIYAFVFGFFVRADNFAHAGGFIAGFLLGSLMEFREDRKQRYAPVWKTIAGLLGVLLAISFILLVGAN